MFIYVIKIVLPPEWARNLNMTLSLVLCLLHVNDNILYISMLLYRFNVLEFYLTSLYMRR